MNIWIAKPDVNNFMWLLFSETDEMDCLQFSSLLKKGGQPVNLNYDIKFHFQDGNYNKIGDVMYASTSYWIVNEKTQKSISNKYGETETFQFISIICEDDITTKYYIMLPLVYCDALNMDKSVYKCYPNDTIFNSVSYYFFNDEAKKYPFFKLKQGDYYHYSGGCFANDDFKEFIEANNITGLKFEKIFEFED